MQSEGDFDPSRPRDWTWEEDGIVDVGLTYSGYHFDLVLYHACECGLLEVGVARWEGN